MKKRIHNCIGRTIAGLAILLCLACLQHAIGVQATHAKAVEAVGVGGAESGADIQPVADKPIAPYQTELLELAFDAASAFPLEPHVKNRGRAQESVVMASFSLEQPQRALRYGNGIVDWRRGSAYAEFALHCVQRGDLTQVQQYLRLAERLSENEEEWRRDQVLSKIAMTYEWLGQSERASEIEARGLSESESGRLEVARSSLAAPDQFESRMLALDQLTAGVNFDLIKGALEAKVELFDRFYADSSRRSLAEAAVKSSWNKMPYVIRVDLLMSMAAIAVAHNDFATALRLIDEVQGFVSGMNWEPEERIALTARIAGLRARAGDSEGARTGARLALAMFSAEREGIVNIYRGRALRPLAEAFNALGDTANALIIYRMAVEEGVENPNSRPRTEDLVAICCSMAVNEVEPDTALWARLREVRQGLGDPW
jgi:tetratricopeptide (TPR) repeat protein